MYNLYQETVSLLPSPYEDDSHGKWCG